MVILVCCSAWGTDVNSGVARFSLRVSELSTASASSRWRWRVRFAEIIANLEQKEHREIFTKKVSNLLPSRRTSRIRGHDPPRYGSGSFLGILPGGGALLARSPPTPWRKRSRRTRELRQGRDPGRGGAGIREQRRRQTSFILC